MSHTLRIGITGGIGSGKSYVARLVSDTYGWPLYDSDRRARQLMTTSADIRRRLTALLGDDAYLPDGQLNRSRVAAYLFGSDANAQRINAIVHPAVRRDWQLFARQATRPVIIESAILVEAGLADTVDVIVAVVAPEALRISRVVARDNTTAEHVCQRMSRQMPQQQLLTHAHHVIVNDGQPLMPQIQKLVSNKQFTQYI